MDEVQRAAERLLHEVKLHEESCDCPPHRPSLHHDIEIVAQRARDALTAEARPRRQIAEDQEQADLQA